jgi:hypothetical protein
MARKFAVLVRTSALSIVLTLLASTIVEAQAATRAGATEAAVQALPASVPAFARGLLNKNVWISADGARVRGRVTSLQDTDLVLAEGSALATIPYSHIVRVEKSTRRIRNGALIGIAAGVGLVLAAVATDGCVNCADEALWVGVGMLFYGGIGGGVGVLVGAIANEAKKDTDVIYDSRRATTMKLSPLISPTRQGVAFSISWR